jgi:hypothetical protein
MTVFPQVQYLPMQAKQDQGDLKALLQQSALEKNLELNY